MRKAAPLLATFALTMGLVAVANTRPTVALDTVYVTKAGDKYHADGCRYLKKSKIAISRSEAQKNGYTPCKVCKP